MSTYTAPRFEYRRSREQEHGERTRHPVIIVGGGPVGLTASLELAERGIPVVLLDDNDTVSVGSRAVACAKRTLDVWDRLGVADRVLKKGVSWSVGKVFFEEELRYQFNLLPEPDHKMPAMVNLQQYYIEEYLVAACSSNPLVDLRWRHKLLSLEQAEDFISLNVETPDGVFTLEGDWVIACDGAKSDTRRMVGANFSGQVFQDSFLIADVLLKKADFPTERWFWFDPPFHPNQSVLLHRQPDDIWRIDFQLGQNPDVTEELKPENIIRRIKAMLGEDVPFELEWTSIYQFACRRIDKFRYGRVIFAGDSAHQVSPFGGRGANSGVQDIDNLGWKLKLVIDGVAPERLLDSYHDERALAADDNIGHSTRATDFITPKSVMSRRFRNAVLDLSKDNPFARSLLNSGRLSTPTPYLDSPLNTPDDDVFLGNMAPGTACVDGPVLVDGRPEWLLNQLGSGFQILTFGEAPASAVEAAGIVAPVLRVGADAEDVKSRLAERYDGRPGTTYLIRPDQHVAARWRNFDPTQIAAAIKRAIAA